MRSKQQWQCTSQSNISIAHFMRLISMLVVVLCLAVALGCAQKGSDKPDSNHEEQLDEGADDERVSDEDQGHEQNNGKDNGEVSEQDNKHNGDGSSAQAEWLSGFETLEAYVAELSLQEKIGQMIIAGVDGTELNPSMEKLMATYHVGGFIVFKRNIASAEQLSHLMNEMRAYHAQIGGPPLFLSVDQEGGRVLRLPHTSEMPTAQAIGVVDDAELSYIVGELLASQLQLYGMNMNFAPVLDIYSNPENKVIGDRAYGSTSETVIKHGIEVMKGLAAHDVIPVIKHFPGHGDTVLDSHDDLPVVTKDKAQLLAFEWQPFQAAINDGADVVMSSHIMMTELDQQYPATLSQVVMTDVLRDELKFTGVVMTDDMTMGAITEHYTLAEAAILAVNAGNDIVLVSHGYDHITTVIEAIEHAVKTGIINEVAVDASVLRILQLKQRYNLTDEPIDVIGPHDIAQMNEAITTLLSHMKNE